MAWTASLISINKGQGVITPTVQFTDTTTGETFTEQYPTQNTNMAAIASLAQSRIQTLQARDVSIQSMKIGPINLTSIPTASQATLAANIFFANLSQLTAMQAAVTKGIIQANDATLTSLLATVQSQYLPQYTTDPRFR
jgi:hypothetical protein